LEKQEIKGPDGGTVKFEVDPFRKQCLLNGWDDIGLTLRNEGKITSFEETRKAAQPWI
jgi:3-isopropylmalate/(R)-2-methylmalate dehydratase small subunit